MRTTTRTGVAIVLLLAAAGCAPITSLRYESGDHLSLRLPGTPRVSIRPASGDPAGNLFPGGKDYNRPRLIQSFANTVRNDFAANVFNDQGPEVRVVVEVRQLNTTCTGDGEADAVADFTIEIKAEDRMAGRFDVKATPHGTCASSPIDVPAVASLAVKQAMEQAKAKIGEEREKIYARITAAPGFASAWGATSMARPGAGGTAVGMVNVAVADLEAQEVPTGTAVVIADWLRGELVAAGTFSVVERGAMNKVLTEQAFQQTGCTGSECAVKLGKILNVQRMIVGSVGKILQAYVVNVRVVDVETGRATGSDSARGASVDEIEREVRAMAKRLAH